MSEARLALKVPAIPLQLFGYTLVICLGLWLFVPLRFQANDDTVMMMLASGAYSGAPSGNLVFINSYLGQGINGLYRLLPGVDWYPGLMLLALSTCCALGIVSVVQNVQTKQPFLFFAWTALGSLLLSVIVQMQFTTTAALSAAVGAWSLLTLPGRTVKSVGAALVIYGFLLRFEAAALVFLVGAPLFVLGLVRGVATRSQSVLLAGVVLLGVGLHVMGGRAYEAQNPDYVAYNDIRGQLNDNRNAALDLTPEVLPEGVSANDYRLLYLDFFADPLEISLEKLSALQAAVSANEQELTLRDFADAARALLLRPNILMLLAAVGLAVFMLPKRGQRLLVVAAIVAFVAPLLYVSVFAILKNRVLWAAFAAVLAGLFYLNLRGSPRWLNMLLQVPLIGLTLMFLLSARSHIAHTLQIEPLLRTQASMIRDWEGPVYIYKNHLNIEKARLFSDDLAPLSQKIVFAGWLVNHPDNQSYQSHKDLLREDAALFMSPDRKPEVVQARLLEALWENYGIRGTFKTIDETEAGLLVTLRPIRDP